MTIQSKVAKKTIETLNDFYGHVYRLSPGVMFVVLLVLLLVNGIIKYSRQKNILDCVYLEIPFVLLKNLFGLGNEFDYLMLSKKERKQENTFKEILNIYEKYVKNIFDLNKLNTVRANLDLLNNPDKSLDSFKKTVSDNCFNSKNEKDSSELNKQDNIDSIIEFLTNPDKPLNNIKKIVSEKYFNSKKEKGTSHLNKDETGEISVDLLGKPDKSLDYLKNNLKVEASIEEDNQVIDEVNQIKDFINQEIDASTHKEKELKFFKLYLQFFVHFFFTVISFLILLLQILIPIHEIENECKPGYSCFKILNKTRESFNCSSISSEEKIKYVCQKHELETFSEFLTVVGAFSGLIALIFKMHSCTLSIFIYVKTKLRRICSSKSQKKSSCRITYKSEIALFVIKLFFEILFLISILVFHAISEQLMIEFLEEEYLVYGCLFISLLLTANSIEKRLYELNYTSKFEIPSEASDAVESIIKNNLMKNTTKLFK